MDPLFSLAWYIWPLVSHGEISIVSVSLGINLSLLFIDSIERSPGPSGFKFQILLTSMLAQSPEICLIRSGQSYANKEHDNNHY